jgi:hypothetical protein
MTIQRKQPTPCQQQQGNAAASPLRLFAQITKVDQDKRLVYGRACQEVVDRSGEIFDYEGSKPYFKSWSDGIAKDTDGKSLGNIRAMHGKIAAGKVTEIDFHDADKAIDICGKIVDDQEWKKVLEGVYTGWSIGGSYVGEKKTEKMADGSDAKRYVADPNEISLVDQPCIPTAKFFDIVKADGVIEKVAFQSLEPAAEEVALEVTGTDAEVAEFAKVLNDSGMTMAQAIDAVRKAKPAEPVAAVVAVEKPADDAPGAAVDKGMWNVQDFASCLACIASVAAAAESDAQWEGDGSQVPEKLRAWLGAGVDIFKAMAKEETDELLASLKGSAGPVATIGVELAFAGRGTAALRKQLADPALTVAAAGEIAKEYGETLGDGFADRVLAKAGARHSKNDAGHLKAAHDALVSLGAMCAADKAAPAGDLAKGADDLAKLTTALSEANARIAKLEAQPLQLRTAALAGIRTVTKGQDSAAPTAEEDMAKFNVYNGDGSVNEAATVTKFVQSLGGKRITAQTIGQP